MSVAKVDKVAGRFSGQFKSLCHLWAICRMGESGDSVLQLANADGIISKN